MLDFILDEPCKTWTPIGRFLQSMDGHLDDRCKIWTIYWTLGVKYGLLKHGRYE